MSIINCIPLVLKKITSISINTESIQQIDKLILVIINCFLKECIRLFEYSPNKVLNIRDIITMINITFTGELKFNLINQGYDASKHTNMTTFRINHVLHPMIFEKILCLNYSSIKVSKKCYFFLSGMFEYLIADILDMSVFQALAQKSKCIMPVHIYRAVHSDMESLTILNHYNIVMIGFEKLIFSKRPFSKIVRAVCNNINTNTRISESVFVYLQSYMEYWLLNFMRKVKLLVKSGMEINSTHVLSTYDIIKNE